MYPLLLSEAEIDALLSLVTQHRDQWDALMAAIWQRLIAMKATIAIEPEHRRVDEMMERHEEFKRQVQAWMKRMDDKGA